MVKENHIKNMFNEIEGVKENGFFCVAQTPWS